MNAASYCPTRPEEHRFCVWVPKDKWIPLKRTPRFLYHLSNPFLLPDGTPIRRSEEDLYVHRFSFVKEGLCGKDKGTEGVWVNTQVRNIHSMMPLAIERYHYEKDYGGNTPAEVRRNYYHTIMNYDIWRIDTDLTGSPQWYIDPNMMKDKYAGGKMEEYLYTEGSIPARALRLFRFDIPYQPFMEQPFETPARLKPVYEINNWIRYIWFERKEVLPVLKRNALAA